MRDAVVLDALARRHQGQQPGLQAPARQCQADGGQQQQRRAVGSATGLFAQHRANLAPVLCRAHPGQRRGQLVERLSSRPRRHPEQHAAQLLVGLVAAPQQSILGRVALELRGDQILLQFVQPRQHAPLFAQLLAQPGCGLFALWWRQRRLERRHALRDHGVDVVEGGQSIGHAQVGVTGRFQSTLARQLVRAQPLGVRQLPQLVDHGQRELAPLSVHLGAARDALHAAFELVLRLAQLRQGCALALQRQHGVGHQARRRRRCGRRLLCQHHRRAHQREQRHAGVSCAARRCAGAGGERPLHNVRISVAMSAAMRASARL